MIPIDSPYRHNLRDPSPDRERASSPAARIEDIVTGAVIVLVGAAFLVGNLGLRLPFALGEHWWALFILVGAVAPASRAWFRWRAIGGVDWIVAHRLLSALATVAVALIFLLDVSFATWWPLFVILGGLYAMFPRRGRRECRRDL